MRSPLTVLVTAAGSAPAVAAIRGLSAQDELPLRVVGVDVDPLSFGLFDCAAAYTVPRVGAPDWAEEVERVCAREDVDVVVPILDVELEPFAALRDRLAPLGTRVLVNEPAAIRIARDKRRANGAVAAAGVAVPRTVDLAVDVLEAPVVVKPTVGAGSVGVSVVRTVPELRQAAAALDDPLVQELVEGDEFTVDLVVSPDGQVLAAAPRRRVEVRAGQSYKGVTVDDDELEQAASAAAAALGLTGPANVQLIRPCGGAPTFIEANPKFAAGMGLTIAAGLNLPLVSLELLLGLPLRRDALRRRAGVRMVRAWAERYVDEGTALPGSAPAVVEAAA